MFSFKKLPGILDRDFVGSKLGEVVVHRHWKRLSGRVVGHRKLGGHRVASLQTVGPVVADDVVWKMKIAIKRKSMFNLASCYVKVVKGENLQRRGHGFKSWRWILDEM